MKMRINEGKWNSTIKLVEPKKMLSFETCWGPITIQF